MKVVIGILAAPFVAALSFTLFVLTVGTIQILRKDD